MKLRCRRWSCFRRTRRISAASFSDLDFDVERQAQRVGDDLRDHGACASAEILRTNLCFDRTVGIDGHVAFRVVAEAAPCVQRNAEPALDRPGPFVAARGLSLCSRSFSPRSRFFAIDVGPLGEIEVLVKNSNSSIFSAAAVSARADIVRSNSADDAARATPRRCRGWSECAFTVVRVFGILSNTCGIRSGGPPPCRRCPRLRSRTRLFCRLWRADFDFAETGRLPAIINSRSRSRSSFTGGLFGELRGDGAPFSRIEL